MLCNIGFPCNKLLFNEIEFPQFHMSSFISQKADGNASGFHKYPRADEIQTRSNPLKNNTSSLNRTRRTLKFECNSKNQALQIRARTLQAAGIRIRAHSKQTLSQQICTMADSATRTTSSTTDDTAICGLKVIFGPTLFNFLQLTKFLKLKL